MGVTIQLPFSFNSTGSLNVTSIESRQWADRVLGAVFTKLNERVMRPTFGSLTQNAIFEPEGSVTEYVSRAVTAAFGEFLPELSLLSVRSEGNNNQQLNELVLTISIDYRLPNKQVDSITTKVGSFTRTGELIQEIE